MRRGLLENKFSNDWDGMDSLVWIGMDWNGLGGIWDSLGWIGMVSNGWMDAWIGRDWDSLGLIGMDGWICG